MGTLPALAACTHLTPPRPDRGVEVLRALAARDAQLLSDAEVDLSALRSAQQTALGTEITRACGTHKDGKPVEQCGSDVQLPATLPQAATAADILADSRGNTALVEALDGSALREDYPARLATAVDGGLVLALRVAGAEWDDLVPAVPVTQESGENLAKGAEDQLGAALQAEYMLIYGTGLAAAHSTGEALTAVMARAERHRLLRDRAREIMEASGLAVPEGAAGYSSADAGSGAADGTEVPSPGDTPMEYLAAIERYCAQAWEDAFKVAKEAPMRLFALQAAGVAAAGSAALSANNVEPLPGLS